MDDDSSEVNPNRELVVNNGEKMEMQKTQMEQWSILSNLLTMCSILSLTLLEYQTSEQIKNETK